MKILKINFNGISPLLMHSVRTANPLDPLSVKMKQVTSKRKKTDEDHILLIEMQWYGSIYHEEKVGPFIPANNLEASILGAAKLQKMGPLAKRAILVLDDQIQIKYKGPRDLDGLFKNKDFVDVRPVTIMKNKVMRCRPIFKEWSGSFSVQYDPQQIQESEVKELIKNAGALIGVCDYRPRYGRFSVEFK